MLANVPRHIRDVKDDMDHNLAHPEFNFDAVTKYYKDSCLIMNSIYDIKEDVKKAVRENIKYIEIHYNVPNCWRDGEQVVNSPESFLSAYFEKWIGRLLSQNIVVAIKFVGEVDTCLNHFTIGFVYGNSNIDCYYSENNAVWPVHSTVHYNSPQVIENPENLLVLKCKGIDIYDEHPDCNKSFYIHHAELEFLRDGGIIKFGKLIMKN